MSISRIKSKLRKKQYFLSIIPHPTHTYESRWPVVFFSSSSSSRWSLETRRLDRSQKTSEGHHFPRLGVCRLISLTLLSVCLFSSSSSSSSTSQTRMYVCLLTFLRLCVRVNCLVCALVNFGIVNSAVFSFFPLSLSGFWSLWLLYFSAFPLYLLLQLFGPSLRSLHLLCFARLVHSHSIYTHLCL